MQLGCILETNTFSICANISEEIFEWAIMNWSYKLFEVVLLAVCAFLNRLNTTDLCVRSPIDLSVAHICFSPPYLKQLVLKNLQHPINTSLRKFFSPATFQSTFLIFKK